MKKESDSVYPIIAWTSVFVWVIVYITGTVVNDAIWPMYVLTIFPIVGIVFSCNNLSLLSNKITLIINSLLLLFSIFLWAVGSIID